MTAVNLTPTAAVAAGAKPTDPNLGRVGEFLPGSDGDTYQYQLLDNGQILPVRVQESLPFVTLCASRGERMTTGVGTKVK